LLWTRSGRYCKNSIFFFLDEKDYFSSRISRVFSAHWRPFLKKHVYF